MVRVDVDTDRRMIQPNELNELGARDASCIRPGHWLGISLVEEYGGTPVV